MRSQKVWYIEYDHRMFQILNEDHIGDKAYEVALTFATEEGPDPESSANVPQWMNAIAEDTRDIYRLLSNFFYVEEKLNKSEMVKKVFLKIYSVLQVEFQYSGYFFIFSEHFRVFRIIASCLRLNKFMEAIFNSMKVIQKNLDVNLIENFDQVCLYMQQKIKETLVKTKCIRDHWLNIILLDTLSLILRNSGDPTMHKILDVARQTRIREVITKSNEIYEEFGISKEREREEFQKNKYFSIEMLVQEDPNKQEMESQPENSQQM